MAGDAVRAAGARYGQRSAYRGLHRFCAWLVEEELAANPLRTLSPPELKMKPVPVLTDAELPALLKACADKDFNDHRDEALVRVLLDRGVRTSEACGLTVDHVDLDQGLAIVKGKGSKVRPGDSATIKTQGVKAGHTVDELKRARNSSRRPSPRWSRLTVGGRPRSTGFAFSAATPLARFGSQLLTGSLLGKEP